MTASSVDSRSAAGYWNVPPDAAQLDEARDVAPLAARRAAGDDATRIDGGATNSGARTTAHTPDGKPVTVDALHRSREVTITRERTLADAGGGQQYVSSDQLVLTTGSGDDKLSVKAGRDGTLAVEVNGESYRLEMAEGQALTLRTGAGNDTIDVASDVKVNLIIDAGDGDDTVATGAGDDIVLGGDGDDTLRTGAGSDYVEGGSGNDTIDAGAGNDVVYGGDGDDTLAGAAGSDYVEGGNGNDAIDGGAGGDMLSGGNGDDRIAGGAGDDRVYTGAGADAVVNAGGKDVVYAQREADTFSAAKGASNQVVNVDLTGSPGAKGLKIEGSAAFVQRVQADVDFLRASPVGRQMLAEFDRAAASGNTVTIRELANEDNGYTMPDADGTWADTELGRNGPGRGDDAVIAYNPSFHMAEFPAPVGVLYHEMSHAYDAVNGFFQPGTYAGRDAQDRNAGVPNSERQAVGLENTGIAYDFDRNPATPATTANPVALTENGLRAELGLPLRLHYAL
jgi:predicted Fe-Mo cluster-binding NifX family protein